jgi:hypothetical protein
MYRHPSLVARKRMNPYNPERRERLFAKAFNSEAFVEFVKRFGCIVPGCDDRKIEVMHWRSRGAGGTWTETVPCCRDHHAESHDIGIDTFRAKYGLDFQSASADLIDRWEQEEAGWTTARGAANDAGWSRERKRMGPPL